jgi:hypothetical protein
LSVVGLLPVGVGSPDQSGEIWSLWFLLSLLELLWPELETMKRATTPSNKAAVVAFLEVWISSVSSSPLAGHGGGVVELRSGICTSVADGAALPSLVGHGGKERWRCGSWRPVMAWKLMAGAAAYWPNLPHLPSLDGRGGEGRRRWALVLQAGSQRQRDIKKLKLRLIPSDSEEHHRYPWPRGARRTSRVQALRSFLFLQAAKPIRRISDLVTAIHLDGKPSGVVPGIVVSGRCSRSWRTSGGDEGSDYCLASPSRVLLVKCEDQFAFLVNFKVLFVIVPTV